MQHSDGLGELAKALAAVQAEMEPAAFNAINPFLKNRYADLGSVISAAKPHLTKHGLAYSQLVGGAQGAIEVETILMHASGEWVASSVSLPMVEEKGKSAAQVAGSIITYLRRYALSAILGVYADEDTDGQVAHRQEQRQERQERHQEPARDWPQQESRPATSGGEYTDGQRKALYAISQRLGYGRDDWGRFLNDQTGRECTKENPPTKAEASRIIEAHPRGES